MGKCENMMHNSNRVFIEKLDGIIKLKALGLNVPEWIYLDSEEFWYYIHKKELSESVKEKITRFIENNKTALYAIRAESKRGTKKKKRPPLSLLNVGIMCDANNLDKMSELHEVYVERAELINMEIEYGRSIEKEVLENLKQFYKHMNCRMEGDQEYNYGVVIQRMVYGNKGVFSGNGIICRSLEDKSLLNGVFLVGQIGIGVMDGSWGRNEITLEEMEKLNPKLFKRLLDDYMNIEHEYGGNVYLEFTIEDNNIYYLDFIKRRKNIYVDRK